MSMMVSAPEYRIKKTSVLRDGWGHFDSIDLGRIVDSFKEAGIIKIDVINGETWYQLSDATIAKYTRFQEVG
jgi:hypothetical protein